MTNIFNDTSTNIMEPPRDTGKHTIYTPFGPCVGYKKLSRGLVKRLNKCCDDHEEGKKPLEDHANHLIGKVSEEPTMPEKLKNAVLDEMYEFMTDYMLITKGRDIKRDVHLRGGTTTYFESKSAWFVRQYENEYNPIHVHTGCHLSCIGYLKIPKAIEKDQQNDPKNWRNTTHGMTEFVYGMPYDIVPTATNFRIKPQVGDFWLFPSTLQHLVYPFQTRGERRSFSMNIEFELRGDGREEKPSFTSQEMVELVDN